MRKIAIIISKEFDIPYNYGDDYYHIELIKSVTDWSIVTDEEYLMLQGYSKKSNPQYFVIERPIDEAAFITKTIEAYKKEAAIAKKEQEKRRALEEKKKKEKEMKKRAKTEAEERALLEELEKKYKK